MSHKNEALQAANTTPELALSPLEAFVQNRLEAFVRANDLSGDLADHLRAVYLMGMRDGQLTLGQLEGGDDV